MALANLSNILTFYVSLYVHWHVRGVRLLVSIPLTPLYLLLLQLSGVGEPYHEGKLCTDRSTDSCLALLSWGLFDVG
jgi:hypothetical protein